MADSGILLIGLGGWNSLDLETQILICLSGIILLIGGLFLIGIDAIRLAAVSRGSIPKSEGAYLGEFKLNGHFFEAYEREGDNGRREFRLVSSPPVCPEQEAALSDTWSTKGLLKVCGLKRESRSRRKLIGRFFHSICSLVALLNEWSNTRHVPSLW